MKKKIILILSCVVAFFATSIAETIVDGETTFKLKASRDGSLYKQGEKIKFVLEATKNGEPVKNLEVRSTLSKDGVAPFLSSKAKTDENGKIVINSNGLNEPGVVRCQVWLKNPDTNKEVTVMAGAGVDVYSIKMSRDLPKDFKSYWRKQKKMLSKIPMNTEMVSTKCYNENVELFDIKVDSYKGLLTGYYARPKGAKPKSCPAIIFPHGAGVRSSNMHSSIGYAAKGFIALDYNAHGIPNGKPAEYYKKLAETELKGYSHFGSNDKDESFFKVLFLRTLRALEFLMAQPEWDGKILIASGTSQGGGQALVAGGICNKVSLVVANVPAICDHTGVLANKRTGGWPKLVKFDKDGNYDEKVLEASAYVDAANFASFIKCKSVLSTGLRDNVCAPSSVFAAYSNINVKDKTIIINEESSHSVPKETYKKCYNIILEHANIK